MIAGTNLRLSAQRAFLGRVHPEMRLIKIKSVDNVIRVTVVLSCERTEEIWEDISIAATEIIADFPEAKSIEEINEVSTAPLPVEHILEEGWIYCRASR